MQYTIESVVDTWLVRGYILLSYIIMYIEDIYVYNLVSGILMDAYVAAAMSTYSVQ
jgi:hypothetical protein